MAIPPWEGYVRQRRDIVEKLVFNHGVYGLADSITEHFSLSKGQIVILFRILATDPSEWSEQQIKFIKDNYLESAISLIHDKVKAHPEQFSPQNFQLYIDAALGDKH